MTSRLPRAPGDAPPPSPDAQGDAPPAQKVAALFDTLRHAMGKPTPQQPDLADILDAIRRDAQEDNSRYHATAAATAAASQRDASRAVRQRPHPPRPPISRPPISHPPRPRHDNAPGLSMLALLLLAGIAALSLIALVAWLLLGPVAPPRPTAPPIAQATTPPPTPTPTPSPSPAPQATPQPQAPAPITAPTPAPTAAPVDAAAVCGSRFARLLAGFTVRREELATFLDDEASLMACRRELDWQHGEHLTIWGAASVLRRYPAHANAADLFAVACGKGHEIGCVWSAAWPQTGSRPPRDAQEMLRRLAPFLDGALPVADTMAALALLDQRLPSADDRALATALLERAASAGDIWAAQELAALPKR